LYLPDYGDFLLRIAKMEEIQEIDGLALFQTGQLGQLKRAQLQKLCKSHGLSAGGKV
jgi:hypothetical protein